MTINTGVFIDDSGNAGISTENKYDSQDRAGWYALVLTPMQREDAEFGMRKLIAEHTERYGVREFHFTDIYSARKVYKHVTESERLDIFEHFAEIFAEMQDPILSHSMTSNDFGRSKIIVNDETAKYANFILSNPKDFSLLQVLSHVKSFLDTNVAYPIPVDIIVDSGKEKPNSVRELEFLENVCPRGRIKYRSSADEPLLQLIDYAAFCLNRCFRLNSKTSKSSFDRALLEISSKANFNTLNIVKRNTKSGDDTKGIHEQLFETAYKKNEHLANITLENFIDDILKRDQRS